MDNSRLSSITFRDRSATPKTFTFTFDDGWKTSGGGVDIEWAKDRGELPTVPEPILGEEQPIEISFNALVKALTSNAAAAMGDFVLAETGLGYVGASWTSTITGGTFSILTIDIDYFDGTNTWRYPDCVIRGAFAEDLAGNKMEFTGVCPHPYPTMNP